MAVVNVEVLSKSGVSVYDLPDCAYHDWYDDGVTAEQAAQRALEAAGFCTIE